MPEYHFYTSFESLNSLPSYFFNSTPYLKLFPELEFYSFYLISELSNQTLAQIHFTILNNKAISHPKAPFGGIETSIENIEVLGAFWQKIETVLINLNVHTIEIKDCPNSYYLEEPIKSDSLLNILGFKILHSDYNFHQETNANSINIFHKSERKRLKKCIKNSFKFEKLDNIDLNSIYDLLLKFRKAKDIPLNISKENLSSSFLNFPENYIAFSVKNNDTIIALSICVKINNNILYHFCLAADPSYNEYSPSVMLYFEIYNYSKLHNYAIFDWGTASINGNKIEGLYNFKTKLGGILSMKNTYIKSL